MTKPLRIAHFIETAVPGGAEKLLIDLCVSLKPQHEPILLHFNHPYFLQQCTDLQIEQHTVPAQVEFKSTRTLWKFALNLKKFLKQQKIDLLHSHLFGPITGAAAGARLAGIPHIGTLHDIYMIEAKPARIRLLQLAALLGTQLITVSQAMEKFYRQRAYFGPQTLRTIYNGARIPKPITQTDRQQLRYQLGVPENNIIIINTGRLVPLKRHDILLDAIAQLDPETPYKLIIVGDGPEMPNIRQKIAALQLNEKIILTGQRQDVDPLLQISDLFVQCSDTEGLSMSIIEAMATQLACIVTDVGGNYELIDNGNTGYRIPAANSTALAEKIQQLISNKTARQTLGTQAHQRILQTFQHQHCMQAYHNLYAQLTRTKTL